MATITVTSSVPADAEVSELPPASVLSGEDNASAPSMRKSVTVLIMVSLCLSALLSALDITIVTTAVPTIAGDFKSSAGYIWIGSAYILASTVVAPLWGSVADIWGRKPIMLLAVATFTAGSLVCALAKDMGALIVGRAIQGIGGSGKAVLGSVVISDLFSLRDRGLYLAALSTTWAVGATAGPLLGGVLTTKLSWRWCFWINLPIGAAVFVSFLLFLKVENPRTPVLKGLRAIDWVGSGLILGGALMVLLGLDFGNVTYPWSSPKVIALIVAGAVGIGLFVFNEWKFTRNPLMPLRLFKTASTSASFAVQALNFFVFNGITYYFPLYSQSVLGVSALTAGVYMVPIILSTCLASVAAALLIQRTGKYRSLMYIAQALLILGVGLLISFDMGNSIAQLFAYEIIIGLGTGLNDEAPTIAALAGTSERDAAATISFMSFLQSLTTTVSIVVGGVVFQNQMQGAQGELRESLGPVAASFSGDQASSNLELIKTLTASQQAVVRRAYFRAFKSDWILFAAVAGLSAVVNLFVRGRALNKTRPQVVLGVDREQATQTSSELPGATELRQRSGHV